MSHDCQECGRSKISCLSLRRFFSAVTIAVVFVIMLSFFSNTQQSPIAIEGSQADLSTEGCITMDLVQKATTNGNCWVVFEGVVYDVSEGEKWGLEGHLGQHFCGGVYTKETIEEGPHKADVMERFELAPLCTEEVN